MVTTDPSKIHHKTGVHPNFQPTRFTPDEIKGMFPDVNPRQALRDFIAYHQAKGDTSADWDASYYNWCSGRQKWADDKRKETADTDSMGLPLDPAKRAKIQGSTEGDYGIKFLEILERHQQTGKTFEQAHAAAVAELEGENPDER